MEREIRRNYQKNEDFEGKMDLEFIEDPDALELTSNQVRSQGRVIPRTAPPRSLLHQRELNPALFGGPRRGQVVDGSMQPQLPHVIQNDQQIGEIKHQVSSISEAVGQLNSQLNEVNRVNQARFDKVQISVERLQSMITKLEQNDHYIVNEAAQKFSQVNSRFAERKTIDAKIQDMIDRHNSVLKSFEMRLSQMQRVIAEKEAQILATSAALNEAKMEIARLKRM